MAPNAEFLKELGVPISRVGRLVLRCGAICERCDRFRKTAERI